MQMFASANVAGYAMILARHVAIMMASPNYHATHRSSKSMYDNEDQVMRKVDVAWQCILERLWKCLIGRYGGCFEERYNEAYDDRAYHAKGLDAPAKYSPTPTRREMHCTEETSKIWVVEVSTIEYL